MATRRQRWLKQRQRYQRRKLHARSVNSVWGRDPVTGKTKRLGYRVVWEKVGQQPPCPDKGQNWDAADERPFGWPYVPLTFSGGGWGKPPHVHIAPTHRAPGPMQQSSRDYALAFLHRRRVEKWRRKMPRFSVRDRLIYLVNLWAWREGAFPDWDPLQRHPNNDDINNGAPYITEFPYVW